MATFTARRSEPEVLSPARATPREIKALSDLDDQRTLRYYETVVGFFRSNSSRPDNPARAIRAALMEALVYYYPIAGRLREDGAGRLVVDCTAEGVVFVEAYVDARLEEFGEPLLPPYPCVEELLCDVGDTRAVLGKPLLFMQVMFGFSTPCQFRNLFTFRYGRGTTSGHGVLSHGSKCICYEKWI
jgi:hypothetical protein